MCTCRRSAVRSKTLVMRGRFRAGVPRMPRRQRIPSYRLHKQSGQAIVTLTDGLGGRRDVLLGPHGTAASRVEYARVIAEWEAARRRLTAAPVAGSGLSVNELLLAFLRHAERHYRYPDGTPT